MQGTIVQINISRGGIPKRPIPEGLITPLGVEGDAVANSSIHGGPRQALLLLCAEAVDELVARGYRLFYGALGENLTTRGLDRMQIRAGQRYRAGQALIEITKLRKPCRALDIYGSGIQNDIIDSAARAGDARSPYWGLSGFYASVLEPGLVRRNDIITLVDQLV